MFDQPLLNSLVSFTQVESTLVMRLGNIVCYKQFQDLIPVWFDYYSSKIHNKDIIDNIVIVWNLNEVPMPISDHNRSAVLLSIEHFFKRPVPVKIITQKITVDNSADIGVEPFEILSYMLYKKYPEVHNHMPWQPQTEKCLYLVGKLRLHRYHFLKYLIGKLSHRNFQYVLHRLSRNGATQNNDRESQFAEWLESTMRNIISINDADDADVNEIRNFLINHETPVYDHTNLQMTDSSQMISSKMIKETSLSLVCETAPYSAKFLSEKTYMCIATGRPFILYHNNEANQYLESRGYKLYAEYNIDHEWDGAFQNPNTHHLQHYADSVMHFLTTCNSRSADIRDIIEHNKQTMESNVLLQLKEIAKLFPKFDTLTLEQQINFLFNPIDRHPFFE